MNARSDGARMFPCTRAEMDGQNDYRAAVRNFGQAAAAPSPWVLEHARQAAHTVRPDALQLQCFGYVHEWHANGSPTVDGARLDYCEMCAENDRDLSAKPVQTYEIRNLFNELETWRLCSVHAPRTTDHAEVRP